MVTRALFLSSKPAWVGAGIERATRDRSLGTTKGRRTVECVARTQVPDRDCDGFHTHPPLRFLAAEKKFGTTTTWREYGVEAAAGLLVYASTVRLCAEDKQFEISVRVALD